MTIRRAGRRRRGRPDHEGGSGTGRNAVNMDAGLRASRGPHADTRLCRDARGRDGGIRQELAEGAGSCLRSPFEV
jgi:hypothetical protein